MKAGENLKYFLEGEDIPENAKLIQVDRIIVGYEEEDENDYHFLQTPNYYPIYKNRYLYELK